MLISVIVPNHGRDLTLLKRSLPKDIGLVVVDIGLERSEQRNIGIRRSHGQALLFLDSDQSISSRLIDECVDLLNQGFDSVYIPEKIIAKSWFGKVRAFERTFFVGTAVDVPRFVRRRCCPMFDVMQKGTEDSDWGNRIKGFRAISKNPLYHHDDIGINEYFAKKKYYAQSLGRFKERNPDDKILNLWYRCFTVYTEKGKWKRLLRHPFFTLGIILILTIRGVIYATESIRSDRDIPDGASNNRNAR